MYTCISWYNKYNFGKKGVTAYCFGSKNNWNNCRCVGTTRILYYIPFRLSPFLKELLYKCDKKHDQIPISGTNKARWNCSVYGKLALHCSNSHFNLFLSRRIGIGSYSYQHNYLNEGVNCISVMLQYERVICRVFNNHTDYCE